jgi:hypothetical protein
VSPKNSTPSSRPLPTTARLPNWQSAMPNPRSNLLYMSTNHKCEKVASRAPTPNQASRR